MPFKSLSSPRRINDIAAEVCSVAALTQANLVAFLATDPVRLTVQPAGGSSGKTINLSLDNAHEIALLSKDIALVRSEDAVWALVDLAHRPRMDQVGRDMRSLCARSSGETALGISWDGSATLFLLNKHEVGTRSFELRGTVRAADVGASDTFVVVDGTEGGQFRMHPGPTPEPGATARAPLPLEAAKLDRLRGGKRLSVLYRRDHARACIIAQQGSTLAAKMVTLESAPTCAGIAETSLFVSFADGRVAFYDGDTLARAGDAMLTPTGTVTLGVGGEPRAMGLTARSSPSLWVGTSRGEVLEVPVIRKAPA